MPNEEPLGLSGYFVVDLSSPSTYLIGAIKTNKNAIFVSNPL
jgi:hypothetical protein